MRKKIGIVGFYRNDMFGVHTDYLSFVEQFGTPVIIPPQMSRKEYFSKFSDLDGLILPGGADIDPIRYSPNNIMRIIMEKWFCYPPDIVQEHFDTYILPSLVKTGLPIFGICRGMQSLNVLFGGTLRNVDWHKQSQKKDDLIHEITFLESGIKQRVNSFHHHALGKIASGFEVLATTTEGIPEIFAHKELPIVAVQYHPERFYDDWSVNVCKKLFS